MKRLSIAVAALVGLQNPQQPQPVTPAQPAFRAGVELLQLHVSAIDGEGRPVPDLQPADFDVTIDGKPRTVRVARFYGSQSATAAPALAAASAPAPRSAVTNTTGNPGRVVVFVVDRDSLRAGSGRTVLRTAARLIDRLTPADASGFVALPAGRLVLGRDHARVREGIQNALGTQRTPPHWRYHVDIREALAFERRDVMGIRHVLGRECVNDTSDCGERVADQAREMLFTVRSDTRATLEALRQVIDGLREIRAPTLILLLSAGVWFEQEALTDFNIITRQAAAARTVIHALHVDQVVMDVEDRGGGPSPFAALERQDGLRQIAASTGGAFYQAVGTAEGVFDRLATEVTNFYELGVEIHPEDTGAGIRAVSVRVKRARVTVRSRRDVMLAPRPQGTDANARLQELLRQPVDVSELPIRLTTYTARGEEQKTLKVILAADLDGAEAPVESVQWGFAVFRNEEQFAYGQDRAERVDQIVTAAQLAPGRYRARFAVVTGDGREGVVESVLPVGLRAYGELQSGDVVLGYLSEGKFRPASSFAPRREMRALVELYAARPEEFDAVTVLWEMYRAPEMKLLHSTRSTPQATDAPGRRICEATLPAPDASGSYVVSAVVHRNGRAIGKVSRALDVR